MDGELKSPYKISLDFYIRKIVTVNAKQLDTNSRIINITCTENGKKIILDSSTISAFVRYKKSDGYEVLNEVQILNDGTVNLELSQQMLAVEGRQIVDIMLINGIGLNTEIVQNILNSETMDGITVLSTMSFYINTEGVAIDGSNIESSYEYNAYIEGLGKMVAVEQRLVKVEENANEAIQKCDVATENANTATSNANNATENANTATSNANNATQGAQSATEKANEATVNADIATQKANEATLNANQAAQETRDIIDNGGIVLKSDIVHNLETDDENKVPDATQVKLLNEMIVKLQTQLNAAHEVYYGIDEPDSSIGKDGDIYMMIIDESFETSETSEITEG